MRILRNASARTVIIWVDEAREGKPITRIWIGSHADGPDISRYGETAKERDDEIASILLPCAGKTVSDWKEVVD